MVVYDHRYAPAALPQGERPGTHCTGGWMGPSVGVDRRASSESLFRLSYPGPPLSLFHRYLAWIVLCLRSCSSESDHSCSLHIAYYPDRVLTPLFSTIKMEAAYFSDTLVFTDNTKSPITEDLNLILNRILDR